MARQKSVIKLEGPLGDLSFYSSVFGDIVRRKGGASKEKIKRSPAFKNLRLHQHEFAGCAAAGKLLRQSLAQLTRQMPDHTLVWRMTRLMNQLKDLDTVSDRGKRLSGNGLDGPAGKHLLKIFDFNSKAPLPGVLKRPVILDQGGLVIKGLITARDLVQPKGATHVRLCGVALRIDLEKNEYTLNTEAKDLKLDKLVQNIRLAPTLAPGSGFAIWLLHLCFFQEINGLLYPLENKAGNCLGVIEVS